jgi:hypothetical protein
MPAPSRLLPATLASLALLCGVGAADGQARPVLAWGFDPERPGVPLDSGAGRVPSVAEALELVPAPDGWGARFGAPGSRITTDQTEAIAFDSAESFVVEFLLRTEQRQFATIEISKDRPGGTVSHSFVLNRAPGTVSFELWSWQGVRLQSRTRVNDGKWHRVTGAYDGQTGQAALLIDGRLERTALAGAGGPRSVQMRVGNNLDSDQPYRGDLAAFRIATGFPEEVARTMEQARSEQVLASGEVQSMYAAYFERIAASRPWRPTERGAWEERRKALRAAIFEDLGLTPEPRRCPLDVRRGGKLTRDGYTVERIYWQAWPGYYASGYLYMPTGVQFPRPAILQPHGHWENGNRNPVVQARCIALAKKGFVSLAPDTVHFTDWSLGICFQSIMAWSNIRGLDLLCEMPEVDTSRIGCTGCSGGAQQTFYLMALEDRIAAAVPVCMVSKFRTILRTDEVHCSCNHIPGIAADTDTPEMAAAFAPRPALIITVTGDWTKDYAAEDHPDVLATYGLYGAEDRVVSSQYVSGHDYSKGMREEAYGFFLRWLGEDAGPLANLEPEHEPESLETLAKLDRVPREHEGTAAIQREFRKRRIPRPPTPANADEAAERATGLRAALLASTRLPELPEAVACESRGTVEMAGVRAEKLVLTTEPEIHVAALLVAPTDAASTGITVVVHGDGARRALEDEALSDVRARGEALLLIDPRWFGEWSDGLDWANARDAVLLNGVILGRSPGACGLYDVLCALRYARTRAAGPVRLVGVGDGGVLALLAASLDPDVADVDVRGLGATYLAGREEPVLPHILATADLPDLAAAIAPRPVRLGGVSNPAAYAVTRATYGACGAGASLEVVAAE